MPKKEYQPIYDNTHCWRLTDLLDDSWDYAPLVCLDGGNTARRHRCNSKPQLARRLFLDFLCLVLDEMIATGDHFKLPVQQGAKWRIVAKEPRLVRSIVRRGAYQCVNLRLSGNRVYELIFEYRKGRRWKRAIMQLDATRYGRLCTLVESGQAYDLN